jgi:hypothetical protein
MTAAGTGSAPGLAAALRSLGLDCDVEAHDRLAVLVPDKTAPDLSSPELRRAVQRLAEEHGFTHVAVELTGAGAGRAPLSRP